ncbi:50S ribosomal protein L25 [Anaerolineales bacterium HSG24]|nr:50S ribosomal protein L25 [Anaerolineales bacterium HSG24]
MIENISLKVAPREIIGKKVKHLRNQGLIPSVLYGKKTEPQSIQIEEKALIKTMREAGVSKLIALEVEGQKSVMTLARDIQRDPVQHNYLHVDFYQVQMDVKVNAPVPIVFEGESLAVKSEGGVLTQNFDQIEVECLPSDIPEAIIVNLDSLDKINATISISDLTIPDNVTILAPPDAMVVKIEPPRTVIEEEEEELEEGAEEGMEPEVLTAADTE